ncbi:MAG: alanine racemase [Desulfatibacillaceae bacterium]|nr:alanine racemase [Desulfatibacillaceae bacterium]
MRAKALIHLDRLACNVNAISQMAAPARLIPVVKSNAYGHGAVPVTRHLAGLGQDFFALARIEEAFELIESNIKANFLVFGRVFPDKLAEAIKAGIHLTACCEQDLKWMEAASGGRQVKVHVKAETGMGRTGLLPDDAPAFFSRLMETPCLFFAGLYSHFATADEADKSFAKEQIVSFRATAQSLSSAKKQPAMLHMANSAALLDLPEARFDAARPGVILYGHYPSEFTSKAIIPKPVMSLVAPVVQVRKVPAGFTVSYGRRFSASQETTLAVLPIGYGDGLHRNLSCIGEVLIRGRRCPVAGVITMDTTIVDVGNGPVEVGDEALVFGQTAQGQIPAAELAAKLGTIPYEITCAITQRICRVYLEKSPKFALPLLLAVDNSLK